MSILWDAVSIVCVRQGKGHEVYDVINDVSIQRLHKFEWKSNKIKCESVSNILSAVF